MQQTREVKYIFKNKSGAIVMMLDSEEDAARWYKGRVDLYGPLTPVMTYHVQVISTQERALPNV